ncbi:fasciclin domain-containing protein [Saccharicrinis sp. FJH62]|uniref:fasciclin domain-containing protein n=1 Tax=Saccharicrinis sp. FJH62 TaxID=3344657 RepID=UPI0035D4A665
MNFRLKSLLLLFILGIWACTDAWESHVKVNDSTAKQTIVEILEGQSRFSSFVAALKSTGLDQELAKMQIMTVWAPDNDAMAMADPAVTGDADSLRSFLSNHFTLGKYVYDSGNASERVKMFGGKVLFLDQENDMIDDVIVSGDKNIPARNGVLHIINQPIKLRLNAWQYIEMLGATYKQTAYLNSLSGVYFNPDVATQTGWTDDGRPVYDTISGLVWQNPFLETVTDLRSEDSTFTVFIVEDQVFDSEYNKFKPYFKAFSGSTVTDSLKNVAVAKMKVLKDYVVTTTYNKDNIPAEVYSPDNVRIPVNPSAIVSTYKVSNGNVFVMSDCAIELSDKIQPLIIEGETEFKWFAEGGSPAGNLRIKEHASGGYDYVLDNFSTGSKLGGLILYAGEVASVKYDFYINAINDFNSGFRYPNSSRILSEGLGTVVLQGYNGSSPVFGPPALVNGADTILVTDTAYVTAKEQLVGSTKFSTIRDCFLQVVGNNNGQAVVVDYIKMVPVFN